MIVLVTCGQNKTINLNCICKQQDPAIFTHVFKRCCINNKRDGTEDDILWDDQEAGDMPTNDNDNGDDDLHYFENNNDFLTINKLNNLRIICTRSLEPSWK